MSRRILLINPPVYDLRYAWARWHQPCGLLKVGNLMRSRGGDVRLIDCLEPRRGRIARQRLDMIAVGNHNLARWHFGSSWDHVQRRLCAFKGEGWIPDTIYVTCMMTFWWEAAAELVSRIRAGIFEDANIILGGVYASLCTTHAKAHFPGIRFSWQVGQDAKDHPADLSLYDEVPHFAGIHLYRTRSAKQVVEEIEAKARLGVREFAFFDEEIPGRNLHHFERVLDLLIERKLDVQLRALGNLSVKGLTKGLVLKMREAGYRQVFLRDDLALKPNLNGDLSAYERGIEVLLKYGQFEPRTEDVTAMVLVGVPGEDLTNVAERITRLSHLVGSVNLVPYQPTPGTEVYKRYETYLDNIPLERQNGKLFPFAALNESNYSDYQELIRLAALLNSKYRSTTFDFLGDDETAKMVRRSIANESWRPISTRQISNSSRQIGPI